MSDSDFVYVVPGSIVVTDSLPATFSVTLVLNCHTPAQALTIPLTFAGTNPNLVIDTSVQDGYGNVGITQRTLGEDTIWTIRSSLVNNVNQTILLGYLSLGLNDPLPPGHDSLVTIHFRLTPGGGPAFHGLDTTYLPPANQLTLVDPSAQDYIMQWQPATILISGDSTPLFPQICLSTASLSFTATQLGALPPTKTFRLSNCGSGMLHWSIAHDSSDWLQVSPASGTGNLASIYVAITRTDLPAGLYQSILAIADSAATNSPQFVDVTYTIDAPSPRICFAPANLEFYARQGGSPPPDQTIEVTNCGGLGLIWYPLEHTDWMTLTASPPATDSGWLSVAINSTNLLPGTYQADITLVGTNADNSPQYVHVTYVVSGAVSDSDRVYILPSVLAVPEAPGSQFALALMLDTRTPAQALTIPLTFAGPNPNLRIDTTVVDAAGNFGITQGNLGRDSLWTVRTTLVDNAAKTLLLGYVSFENALPPSQDTLATIHFALDAGGGWGLHEIDTAFLGPYNQLFITDPDANDVRPQWGPAAVWIGDLGPGPILCLSTDSLGFVADSSGPIPVAKWLGIFNCGLGPMAWEVTPLVPWLNVTPSAGADDSAYVAVRPNSTALSPGVHWGHLEILSDEAGNAPETVQVAYVINPRDSSYNGNDSDFVWVEPPALAMHSDVDTAFALTVMLQNKTPASSIALPLTWVGPNANLQIDTTVQDGYGNRGIKQGPLGEDTLAWTIRSSLIGVNRRILIGYVSFGDPLPPSSGALVALHFRLAAGGAEGTHALDTTTFVDQPLTIVDPNAIEYWPHWSPGFISIAGTRNPQLCLSTHSLTFTAPANGAPPPAKQLLIYNCGGGTFYWDLVENIPWLMLQPASGSDSGYVMVNVTSTNLAPGVYTGNIVVYGIIKHPDTVRVTYTVTNQPPQATEVIYLTPGIITLPTGVDTSFDITIMLHTERGGLSAICIPLTFAGSGPKVTIDTTIPDGLGHLGVTQKRLGSDSIWENIVVKVDNMNQTILLNYLDFDGSTFGAVDDSLVTLHFRLAASADPVLVRIDTTFIPPANHLVILDQNASDFPVGWSGGTVTTGTTNSGDEPARPDAFALDQNYPNPFNAGTRVQFKLPKAGFVELKVFNILGMPVRTLVARDLPAGIQTVIWDGADEEGRPVASGTYFYRLRVGQDFEETRGMTLLR